MRAVHEHAHDLFVVRVAVQRTEIEPQRINRRGEGEYEASLAIAIAAEVGTRCAAAVGEVQVASNRGRRDRGACDNGAAADPWHMHGALCKRQARNEQQWSGKESAEGFDAHERRFEAKLVAGSQREALA